MPNPKDASPPHPSQESQVQTHEQKQESKTHKSQAHKNIHKTHHHYTTTTRQAPYLRTETAYAASESPLDKMSAQCMTHTPTTSSAYETRMTKLQDYTASVLTMYLSKPYTKTTAKSQLALLQRLLLPCKDLPVGTDLRYNEVLQYFMNIHQYIADFSIIFTNSEYINLQSIYDLNNSLQLPPYNTAEYEETGQNSIGADFERLSQIVRFFLKTGNSPFTPKKTPFRQKVPPIFPRTETIKVQVLTIFLAPVCSVPKTL